MQADDDNDEDTIIVCLVYSVYGESIYVMLFLLPFLYMYLFSLLNIMCLERFSGKSMSDFTSNDF